MTIKYMEALNLLKGRKEAIEHLQDKIEQDCDLIGATAIEDKL